MNVTFQTRQLTLLLASFISFLLYTLDQPRTYAQGCVIARGAGACMMPHHHDHDTFMDHGDWLVNLSYRWLKSDHTFLHREEQEQREQNGTAMINDQHFFDLTATYAVNKQFWLNLTVPFVHSDRSSMAEHKGDASGERYHTQAGGLADMRMSLDYWLINPEKYHKGNIALGIGIKAPTGDYEATDTFIRRAGPTERFVDSSIQPGDGGWGFYLQTQGYHMIAGNLSAYWNGYYLFNPRELVETTGYSVPDAYLGRAGFSYHIFPEQGITLSLGGRVEGVPPEDVIGGSQGFRRPGYAISIEPGISFTRGKFSIDVTIPVALERNSQTASNGITYEAAFADYTVNASISYRF